MKLARLLGITMSLLTHELITAKAFAAKYEVSKRTILRDMDELAAAGIPIVAIQGNAGGFSIMESFRIERNFLTVSEMDILKTMLEGFSETAVDEETMAILDKLNTISQQSGRQRQPRSSGLVSQKALAEERGVEEPNSLVMDFKSYVDPIHTKHMVSGLRKAIENALKVEIVYYNNNGHESKRIVHPYQLMLKSSAWYLHGYCEKAMDFRIFKLSRIKVIFFLEDNFSKQTIKTPEGSDFLGSSKVKDTLILQFKKEAYSRLNDYFDRQQMDFQENGDIIVRINYPIDEWIYFTILSFGHFVEVLEPNDVREEIKHRIEVMQQIYRD